jgi:hypothetical protein
MTAIRVVFDGKAFIPQQAVALPAQSEAIVFFEAADPSGRQRLDEAVRAYYQQGVPDSEDEGWGQATGADSHRAWTED